MPAPALLRRAGDIFLVVALVVIDLLVWNGDSNLRGGADLPVAVVPVLTVLVFSALLFRWRRPGRVFALQWLYALGGLALPDYGTFAGLALALYAVARRHDQRVARIALASCAVPFGIDSYNSASQTSDVVSNVLVLLLLWGALAFTFWGLGRRARRAEVNAEDARRRSALDAVEAERLRLARELHDIVSHAVSAMLLQAAGAKTVALTDGPRARQSLELIETTGVQAMVELHRLLGLLRARDAVDLAGADDGHGDTPGVANVGDLVALARSSDVDVQIVVDGSPRELDRSIDLAAYRIVQESLTNTVKHAGRGAASRIHLLWGEETLTIDIRDRCGFDRTEHRDRTALPSSGFGLIGLRERVTLIGGELETGPAGDGYVVHAQLPIRSARPVARP